MKVLVAWADNSSTNLGVRALAQGARALVRSVWPNAEIDCQSFGNGASPVAINNRSFLAERVPGTDVITNWLKSYDLMVDMRWGDSFTDIYGIRRLVSMNEMARLANKANVPVVYGPQTLGPFDTSIGRYYGRQALSRASAVVSRDSKSSLYANRLGRPVNATSTDVVFGIDKPVRDKTIDVALNISGLLWNPNPHVNFENYRSDMTALADRLVASGREVTLFAHVLDSSNHDNDVPALAEFVEQSSGTVMKFIPNGLDEVRAFVASANLVIGARMHACLNALSVGTPAIPLAYSRKFAPLLSDLGWNHTIDLNSGDNIPTRVYALADGTRLESDLDRMETRAQELIEVAADTIRRAVE